MSVDFADVQFNKQWTRLLEKLSDLVGRKPDMNAILFLIGVQELGKGKLNFTKEQKQDLMHIATCKLLSMAGFYELDGHDQDGWPHWKQIKPMPKLNMVEQEKFLKIQAIEYFAEIEI
jgi:hypothetical protein